MLRYTALEWGGRACFGVPPLYLVFSIISFLIFVSCEPAPKLQSACNCPFQSLPGTIIEFDSNTEASTGWDTEIDFGLAAKINSWLRGELKVGVSKPGRREKAAKRVYRQIKDTDPQRTYDLVVSESFFCAYYQLLCETTTLTEDEKVELSIQELERLRDLFESSLPPPLSSTPPPPPSKQSVTILTEPRGANIYISKANQPGEKSFQGKSNRELWLNPGSYQVEISLPGFVTYTDVIVVPPGKKNTPVFTAILQSNHSKSF